MEDRGVASVAPSRTPTIYEAPIDGVPKGEKGEDGMMDEKSGAFLVGFEEDDPENPQVRSLTTMAAQ